MTYIELKSKLDKVYFIVYILVFTGLAYLVSIPFYIEGSFLNFEKSVANPIFKENSQSFILKVLIFAPIVETLIFQGAVISSFRNKRKIEDSHFQLATISSILFGLSHFYSLKYIIVAFFVGYILAYARLFKYESKYALLYVGIIHALRNLIGLLYYYL